MESDYVALFFFNWNIIGDLQCCVSFCHTVKSISHMYTAYLELYGNYNYLNIVANYTVQTAII